MSRKRLLMATSNYWQSPLQVGSHHLARGFVKAGWDVAFISDPISPWHLFGGHRGDLRIRYDTYAADGLMDCDGRLWTYVPGAMVTPHNKPILKSEWVAKHWARFSRPRLTDVLHRHGFGEVDLLYCDSVIHQGWLHRIGSRASLYRVTDNISGFAKSTPAVLKLEATLARQVDVVLYAARSLEEYVKGFSPRRMAYLPNGVNYAHFSGGAGPVPAEYADIPRPIALYVGAMDFWFDYRLMNEVASLMPAVSFVFVGPEELAKQRLQPRSNVYVLGRRSYTDLPPYMHHADAGLIPFDVAHHAELVRSIHPLKLYEYFACGLPVVAVEWEELRYLNSPAVLCRGTEQFVRALKRAIEEPPNHAELRRYASLHDWERRVDTMCSELGV